MKLIIDIPKKTYNEIKEGTIVTCGESFAKRLVKYIKNGTVIVNEADVDCVSRKKLLDRIDAERRHLLDVGMDGAEHILVHHARRIIEDMPSVEPTRPKGKWIPLEGDLKKCPVCGEHSLCPSKFCCSCGAELEINSVSIFGCAED